MVFGLLSDYMCLEHGAKVSVHVGKQQHPLAAKDAQFPCRPPYFESIVLHLHTKSAIWRAKLPRMEIEQDPLMDASVALRTVVWRSRETVWAFGCWVTLP